MDQIKEAVKHSISINKIYLDYLLLDACNEERRLIKENPICIIKYHNGYFFKKHILNV